MNKSIFELERYVKDQYAEDKSDPNMYSVLRTLSEAILVRKKYVFTEEEADEISHAIACDLYMRLNDPETDFSISAWTRYIMMIGRRFVSDYVTQYKRKQVIDLSDPVDYHASPFVYQGTIKVSDIEKLGAEEIVRNLSIIVTDSINEFSKYRPSTDMYDDIVLSIKLSLVNDSLVVYNNSSEREVKFLLKLIKERLKSYVISSIDYNYYEEDISSKVTGYELYEDPWDL